MVPGIEEGTELTRQRPGLLLLLVLLVCWLLVVIWSCLCCRLVIIWRCRVVYRWCYRVYYWVAGNEDWWFWRDYFIRCWVCWCRYVVSPVGFNERQLVL